MIAFPVNKIEIGWIPMVGTSLVMLCHARDKQELDSQDPEKLLGSVIHPWVIEAYCNIKQFFVSPAWGLCPGETAAEVQRAGFVLVEWSPQGQVKIRVVRLH